MNATAEGPLLSVSDLKVRRYGDQVSVEPLRTRGDAEVSVVFSH